MLELIVLGKIPGTNIELSITTVLFVIILLAITSLVSVYIFINMRRIFELHQHVKTIELLSL